MANEEMNYIYLVVRHRGSETRVVCAYPNHEDAFNYSADANEASRDSWTYGVEAVWLKDAY